MNLILALDFIVNLLMKECKISELESVFREICFKIYPDKCCHSENILDEKEANWWSMVSFWHFSGMGSGSMVCLA